MHQPFTRFVGAFSEVVFIIHALMPKLFKMFDSENSAIDIGVVGLNLKVGNHLWYKCTNYSCTCRDICQLLRSGENA